MKRFTGLFLALALALGLAAVGQHAQTALAQGGPYSRFGTSTVPTVTVAVYSDTAGIIPDGTVVISDTTSTYPTMKRFGVLPWAGTSLTRPKILGIAYGNIPAKGTGIAGQVLIMGYHGNVKMGASGLSAGASIKTAIGVNGAITTVADSLSGAVGWFLSYNSNSTAANNRGKCVITRPLGFFFGSL